MLVEIMPPGTFTQRSARHYRHFDSKAGSGQPKSVLNALMARYALTETELAQVFGVNCGTLSNWRKGYRSPCASARRMIWLVAQLAQERGKAVLLELALWQPLGSTSAPLAAGADPETEPKQGRAPK